MAALAHLAQASCRPTLWRKFRWSIDRDFVCSSYRSFANKTAEPPTPVMAAARRARHVRSAGWPGECYTRTLDDDRVGPVQRADRTATVADAPQPRQQKRMLRTPVVPSMPPRLEATATSVGLVAAAVAKAARSVTVFVDNQTTMPLVLTDKRIGPKDGRWTWSEQLVPARIRQNEQIVMASESIGGTSHERRPLRRGRQRWSTDLRRGSTSV